MIGSFITRGIILTLGFIYPTYECYKVVEKKSPNLEQLQFWCQYWMIIAILTVLERLGDVFISWLPIFNEAKLAFVIYLWYPKTMGTTYIYNSILRPFIAKHELEIDQNLNELKTRTSDIALLWCQKGFVYIQTQFFELLQFLAIQSNRAQKVSLSTKGTPISPTQHSIQKLVEGSPQNSSLYLEQPLSTTTSVGVHLDPSCLQGNEVHERVHFSNKTRPHSLLHGEKESKLVDQMDISGHTLPAEVLNTKFFNDNPWFVLARIKLLLLLFFTHKAT